ncbi:MAG: hypothetical protein COX51_07380 [Syntrophobacteraceae bacterium CG23_combo_of_CG06-09_8_20_14_all_50_8]|nr:MAG: hypothetical protein COX51_07380 [Syntrophobacteraceae bacterium CG23_combo_of_CG06-09_8_20_14_all_50_8]
MKFLTDGNLGKLSKWLRILGYDTLLHRGNIDLACLMNAQKEGRVVLTRKQALSCRQYAGRLLALRHDRVDEQIGEVFEKLSLHWKPERFFSRCVKCNVELEAVAKEAVAHIVSDYVLENSSAFRRCPSCGGIFWPGTHKDNMLRFIRRRIPFHRPESFPRRA